MESEKENEDTARVGLDDPICSASVDLCLRMMIHAFYDEERNRKCSEVKELLLDWFSAEEIEAASDCIRRGVIPPVIDLSFYEQNDQGHTPTK